MLKANVIIIIIIFAFFSGRVWDAVHTILDCTLIEIFIVVYFNTKRGAN